MKILLADTSSSVCITALSDENGIICENSLDNGRTHSENFMPLLEKTLKDTSTSLDDIDYIATVAGPGSFTGIRIGIASIKALAEVKNKRIISIDSLTSLAGNENKTDKDFICSLIDARNDQVYVGLFDKELNKQEELMADDINIVLDKIKNYNNICFVGNGAILHKEKIEKAFEGKNISFSENNKQSAYGLWIAAIKKLKNQDTLTADELVPLYLKKSQAERLKK